MRDRAVRTRIAGHGGGGRLRAKLPVIALALAGLTAAAFAPFAARAAGRYAATLPCFTITEVRVHGLKYVQTQDFINYIGDPRGQSVFGYDMETVRRRMAAHPWLKGSSVRRELPGAIVIEAAERVPAAVADTGSGRFIIDTEGVALAKVDGPAWDCLPVIKYASSQGLVTSDKKSSEGMRRALELLSCIMKDPDERLAGARLAVGEDGCPTMELGGELGGTVVKVGTDGYEEKVRRLSEVVPDIRKRSAAPAVIDLRFPGKVVVKEGRRALPG